LALIFVDPTGDAKKIDNEVLLIYSNSKCLPNKL